MNRLTMLLGVLAVLIAGSIAQATESGLGEQEVPSLRNDEAVSETVRRQDRVVLFYNRMSTAYDQEAMKAYGVPAQALADEWMRALLAFRNRLGLAFRMYKADWMELSPEARTQIGNQIGIDAKGPEANMFAAYSNKGATVLTVKGPARPDMLAGFANDVIGQYAATRRTDKGECLWVHGWMVTDMKARFVSLAGMRTDRITIGGASEQAKIIQYESVPFNGSTCSYESILLSSGALLGITESCGARKTGYFDYDRTGQMRYRVPMPAP